MHTQVSNETAPVILALVVFLISLASTQIIAAYLYENDHDSSFNQYVHKLLSLCKENNCCILNDSFDDGKCTYHSILDYEPAGCLLLPQGEFSGL